MDKLLYNKTLKSEDLALKNGKWQEETEDI